jgi:hypothetical protein
MLGIKKCAKTTSSKLLTKKNEPAIAVKTFGEALEVNG